MKIRTLLLVVLCLVTGTNTFGQQERFPEKFGKTLNLGLGAGGYSGYYGYARQIFPVFHINYEFSVAKSFTLAPFLSFYSYQNKHYWGDNDQNYPFKYYYYRETVLPIGVKGTYYFDKLLKANPKWDFYLAGSFGFAVRYSTWDNDYYGDKDFYHKARPLFLDIHAGTEYHFSKRLGVFLDLSSSVATLGLAIH